VTDPGGSPTASATGRRILLLVGSVGAGKGTQAAALSSELGLAHLASGNLFRKALRDGSPLGEQARAYIESQAGKHFDPKVAETLLRMLDARP